MRALVSLLLLAGLLMPLHGICTGKAAARWQQLPKPDESFVQLPPQALRIGALDFLGITTDYLYLETMVALGTLYQRQDRMGSVIDRREWEALYARLTLVSQLDPCFLDPYYLATFTLPWDAKMVDEANTLLERGAVARSWDWQLPFYLGFNHFYFRKDFPQAARYLMEAARRPQAPQGLTSFATRLAAEGKQTENAIIFLRSMLSGTTDPRARAAYEKRLKALEAILVIERALGEYQRQVGHLPADLSHLVGSGLLPALPRDPYGGTFYLSAEGNVETSSKLSDPAPGTLIK